MKAKSEIPKSAIWALAFSLPISFLGVAFSMGLAHSSGLTFYIANILFFPFLVFSVVVDTYFKNVITGNTFNVLALLSQFIGYFVAVILIRFIYRKMQVKNT